MEKPIWKSDPNWTQEEFLEKLKEHNRLSMEWCLSQGWWESLDDRGNPVDFPKKFLISEHPTMGTILVELGVFPSINQVKKNNMDIPSKIGTFTVGKKRIRFEIVDE